jgi:2-polyprenyl-3-methyl-5-hydroxy-6-metoxy-1,4-benzoquinol methylase
MAVRTWSAPVGEESREAVACPLCGESGGTPFLEGAHMRFVRCPSCSLVYQDPRPRFEDLRARYGAAYFSYELAHEAAFHALMELGLRDIDFESVTAGMPRPRRFLDVGCATGLLIESMTRRGWEAEGVDLCRESAEYGREHRGAAIRVGTLEQAGFAAGSFSVVHFSHLIEHVPDPRGFLREVHRVLSPGGLAVVTTPNVDGLQARLFGAGWRSAIPDHLALFSRRTLCRLLGECGLTVRRTVTWGGLARGTAPLFLKKPADRLAKKWGFGDVVLALAERAG